MGKEVGWVFAFAPLYIPLSIFVLWQQENSVQPGKRPLSFLLPTVVRPAEGLCGTYLALGANGAARGLSGLTQVRATPLWIFCSQELCCDLVCHVPHIVSHAFTAITVCTALCQAYKSQIPSSPALYLHRPAALCRVSCYSPEYLRTVP